jgi:hypothetical protein
MHSPIIELDRSRPLASIQDLLDPASLPARYALIIEADFARRQIAAGDALVFDQTREPEIGDVVIMYFRDRAEGAPPWRLVGELATSHDVPRLKGGNVKPVIGLYLDEGIEAAFFDAANVLAVHRLSEAVRDLLTSTQPPAR